MKKGLLPLFAGCLLAMTMSATPVLQAATDGTVTVRRAGGGSLTIEHEKFKRAEGKLGETTIVGKIHVKAEQITTPVLFDLRGKHASQFAVSPAKIEPGTSETDVTVTYVPTTVNVHKATLAIDCTSIPEQSQLIHLEGVAYDPANPPSVTTTSNTLSLFTCEEKKTTEQTIEVTSAHMADNVYITMAQKKAFRVSTSSIYKNISSNLRVTFAPLKTGEYKDTIIVSSYGLVTQRIPVVGNATAATGVEQKEGVELKLTDANPLTLLNEHFDGVTKNKPLQITGWTNSAVVGKRAWWGFVSPSYDPLPNESMAKVTPFDSKVEQGEETPCEMMLVTPPLDFVNAKSKMLTLRVRGDYLQDNQTDEFKIYYMDIKDGDIYKNEITGFNLPDTKDESGEWNEYHLNLEGQPIHDVFFIGFGFKSKRGVTNSATYYIDDVSFGRTDLPVITPSATELAMNAIAGKDNVSEAITVTTKNLTQPVTLTVGGPNASKFKVDPKQISKDGGSFKILFRSDKIGVHQAFIKLKSRGAADQYIVLSVNNQTATGIHSLSADELPAVVYDLAGNEIMRSETARLNVLKAKLQRGVYVVRTQQGTQKITVE